MKMNKIAKHDEDLEIDITCLKVKRAKKVKRGGKGGGN